MTVSAMTESVSAVSGQLKTKRTDENFARIYTEAEKLTTEYGLIPVHIPRHRHRKANNCQQPEQPVHFFRKEYFSLIDTSISQLEQKFLKQSDLKAYAKLESSLLSANCDEKTMDSALNDLPDYPELDLSMLKPQLQIFRQQCTFTTVGTAAKSFQKLPDVVKARFHK